MPYLMRIFQAGDSAVLDETLPEKCYLKSYDVDAIGGVGTFEWTADRAAAMRFDSLAAVLTTWKTRSRVRPVRSDGKPNRPLTALTITPEPLDE